MQSTLNAKQLGNAVPYNLNTNLVDANWRTELLAQCDALAEAIKGMRARGELEIAQRAYAEFQQARCDANKIARRIGAEEV